MRAILFIVLTIALSACGLSVEIEPNRSLKLCCVEGFLYGYNGQLTCDQTLDDCTAQTQFKYKCSDLN